jgi:hypothetical protein
MYYYKDSMAGVQSYFLDIEMGTTFFIPNGLSIIKLRFLSLRIEFEKHHYEQLRIQLIFVVTSKVG